MNSSKKFLLLVLLAVFGLALLSPSTRAWQTTITDNQGSGHAVVVDANGDVIAIGSILAGSDVVKLSGATGEVIWRFNASYYESATYASDLAIDSHGDVFVVFVWSRKVIKLSGATGTLLWSGLVGGTLNAFQPVIYAITVDADGNVITAGTVGGLFNVCKLRGTDGAEMWHYEREGLAKAVAADPSGDVAAAGIMNRNFAVAKLQGASGQELWQREINGTANFTDSFEEANAVAMDTDGSVVVAGVISNADNNFGSDVDEAANFRDFTVAKYFPDGRTQWIETVDGKYILKDDRGQLHNQSNDIANAVTIDKDGNVVAAGSIQNSELVPASGNVPEHFHVVKIAREGGIIWENSAGGDYTPGHALAVSSDLAGNVIAAGEHNHRFAVVKFSGGTGGLLWTQQPFSGDDRNHSIARDVITDTDKNVVVTGESLAPDQFPRFTVIKLRGTDGTDYFPEPSPTPTPTPSPTPDFEGALLRYKPILRFNLGENYFPVSVESITDNSGNKLQRRVFANAFLTIAKSPPAGRWPVLSIDFLGEKYPSPVGTRASAEDFIDERNDYQSDANRIQSDPHYADRIYGRIYYGLNERGKKVAWLQYWFFYYYNDYRYGPFTPDQHEGDWEMIQIALASNAHPLSAVYAQHDYASQCVWDEIERINERPIVYVARGSHASYFHAGRHRIILPGIIPNVIFDYANGLVSRPDPELKIILDVTPNEPDPDKKLFSPNWVNWRGHWGGTTKPSGPRPPLPFDADSPRGPKFQGTKWKNPPAFSSRWPFDCR